MDKNIDTFLYSRNTTHKENHKDRYIDHYLEQYRMYLHIFNSTSDRRNKSNEFFLGLNTAIIAALGYLEVKGGASKTSIIFLFIPFIGIAICYFWYEIINSYRQLNRNKFKVIHKIEENLPVSLFKTEWELLGKGKDRKSYFPLSLIERKIPITFIILYVFIFLSIIPYNLLIEIF